VINTTINTMMMLKEAILLLCVVHSCLSLTCYSCKAGDGVKPKGLDPKANARNCGVDTNYLAIKECPKGTKYCFKDSYRGNVTLGCADDAPPGDSSVCIGRKPKGKKGSILRVNRCWCKTNKCNKASSVVASFAIVAALSIKAVLL